MRVDYWWNLWRPVYEGDSGTGDPGAGDPGAGDPGTTPPPSSGGGQITFTPEQQKKVDEIVQGRLAKVREQNQKNIEQLEALKKHKGLTDQEKEQLQARIDELNQTMLTKEELAAKEKKDLESRYKTELEAATSEAKSWRTRYEDSTIQRELQDVAIAEEAYRPSQIVALLRPNTSLVEELADGQPTGRYVAKVKFNGRDSKGQPKEMLLTVAEAVKEMKKMTDEYGNLFKSGATGGVGGGNLPGTGNVSEDELADHDAWLKYREQLGLKG